MTSLKRLVLFVEGDGDSDAVPTLINQMLTDLNAWDCLILDGKPMIVGEIGSLIKADGKNWKRYLEAARRSRKNLGAVLLLLDGDIKKVQGENFCAKTVAQKLASLAEEAGAGKVFSVAVVFACQEYESWIIACIDKLAGQPFADGRPGVKEGTTPPEYDLEKQPRDAKGWLRGKMEYGYNPQKDQKFLTRLMTEHLSTLRDRKPRSFQRLDHALVELVDGLRQGKPFVSPSNPETAEPS
jgi:hypothetical protein